MTLLANALYAEVIWQNEPYKIDLQDNVVTLFHDQDKIVVINSLAFNFIEPDTIITEIACPSGSAINLKVIY